ncbi:rRNA maturation RNase YbeY [Candidatus Curtissbacteria bacterium]|nr:rRNA maturation RNase YbeY [Candidatus Curtissbacteria bacterium]
MLTVLISSSVRYPVNRKVIRRAATDTISRNTIGDISAEISVAVVGERKMSELTQKYLSSHAIPEVLSFPLEDPSAERFINPPDGVLRLGDVVLCWPRVLLAAERDGVMVDDEVYLLTSHAVEHLLGKHHE